MRNESPLQIEHDGASLFALTMGSGLDVVLLHPTPAHHAFWLPVAERLADRYRLTLIDLRGHGQSSAGKGTITMARLAEDVHAILGALGIQRAAFVGCSIGTYTLYEYWRRFPEQMAALVCTCGKPQPDSEANRNTRRESMQAAQQAGGLKKFFDRMADTLVGPTARQHHPEIQTAARNMMDTVSLPAMLAVQQGLMERPDSVATLSTINVPICVVAAGEDQSSTPPEMRVIAEQAPDAEFHLVENAGHYAPFEQQERFASLIGEFLDQKYQPHATFNPTRKAL
ncbi:MAG TPA: alpha/beta hydrolase [Acidobacteriaceae bacterium]|nr:alpha/beta hydrolase [Acidobacteriaceae bacterium]